MPVLSNIKLKLLEVVKLNLYIRVVCLLCASFMAAHAFAQDLSGWSDKTVCRLVESNGGEVYIKEASSRGLECKASTKTSKAKPTKPKSNSDETIISKSSVDTKKTNKLTSYEIMKTIPYFKIGTELTGSEGGKRTDYRTITVGDFNNDGKKEILALVNSIKYDDYLWKNNNFSRGKAYHQKGTKLSADKSWNSYFVSFIHPGPSISESFNNQSLIEWNIKVVGEKGCVHPSQVLPAYLNEDDLTDFVIVCTGYDGHPFSGEHSLIMLSNGPNNYTIDNLTKSKGYYHDGSTADFNNDGFMDIMLADTVSNRLKVYINNGKGKFTKKNKYFPQYSSIRTFTTEIFDINDDGYFDVFLGGHEDGGGGGMPTKILFGNKDNKFSTKEMKFVPNVKGYENVLDVIRIKDHLFIVRTASRPNFYEGAVIQQVSTKTMKTVSVHKNETMDWIRRIFKLKSDEKGFHYGSLSYHTKMLDFSFEDNELKLLYKIDEGQILEGLNKKTAAGSTIFSEDFEIEGKLAIRVDERNNKWYIKQDGNGNSIYCNKATDNWTHFTFGRTDWSNYSISYRMKFLAGKGGQTETHIRKADRNDYRATIGSSGGVEIDFKQDRKNPDNLASDFVSTKTGEWLDIQLTASGDNIKYLVDGEVVASAIDDRLKKGSGLFSVSANSEVCIDDIVVNKM